MEAKKVVVGVLRLLLMSGEADFDDQRRSGSPLANLFGRAGTRRRSLLRCKPFSIIIYEDMGFKGFVLL